MKEIKVNEIRNMYQLGKSKILGYEQFEKNNKQYLKIYLDSDIYRYSHDLEIDSNIKLDPTMERMKRV